MDWHSLGRSFLSFYFIYIVICISNLPNGCNASVFSETYFWQCGCEIHTKSHLVPLIRFPSPIRLVSYWNMQLTGYWLYTTSSWNVYNYKSVYLWKTLKKKKEKRKKKISIRSISLQVVHGPICLEFWICLTLYWPSSHQGTLFDGWMFWKLKDGMHRLLAYL